MKGWLTPLALALVVVFGVPVGPANAEPAGSIKWVVDHHKKTITVTVQLQIYSACSGDPAGTAADKAAACGNGARSQVTLLLAQKIKKQAETIWNKPYRYRCYRLIVIVDVKLATDKDHVDADRVGVRVDPSPAGIRDYVAGHGTRKYLSNDPADRFDPSNDGDSETTWGEQSSFTKWVYAHELGHVLGLDDGYRDVTDPRTGKVTSEPYSDAPQDLMSTGTSNLTQETIDRLVERNRNGLVDSAGKKVNLNDLVCEPQFLVQLKADQSEYSASHFMNSARGCPSPPTTSSISQTLKVFSEKVEVRVVEAPELQPLGYILIPAFDVLTLQNGLTGGGRSAAALGLFDMPVSVEVRRSNDKPATRDIPPVRDFADNTCAGGQGGTPPPGDCGLRTYPAWMAMSQRGADELWPMSSSLPAILKDLGYQSPRFERLYKNCSGPTPWPAAFAEQSGATMVRGKLPSLATLTKVSEEWAVDGVAGKIVIEGSADLHEVRPGRLVNDFIEWKLTMCPLNKDGQTPPDCP